VLAPPPAAEPLLHTAGATPEAVAAATAEVLEQAEAVLLPVTGGEAYGLLVAGIVILGGLLVLYWYLRIQSAAKK
jgi:hypothetical protein